MSGSEKSGLSIGGASADHPEILAFARNERYVAPYNLKDRYDDHLALLAESLSKMLSPLVESIERIVVSIVQQVASAPTIPGHEELLIEKVGYSLLAARFWAYQIHHWGELYAAEINEGRRVRAIVDEIAKADARSALVISRRAMKFRDQCRSVEAGALIGGAIQKAHSSLTTAEFDRLVALACERDETACRDLGIISKQLAPYLPEKRGRPISEETCIHLFLLRHLESWGFKSAYTYSDADHNNFTDQVTRATRLAVKNPRFSPLHANRLRKDRTLLPPVLIIDSAPRQRASSHPPNRQLNSSNL